MAMTSPTDFIWVVRRASAVGNFERETRHLGDHVVDRGLEQAGVAPPVISFFSSSSV